MVDGMVGRYRLLTRIASGAQATVYRATDTRDGSLAALKVLDPRLAADPTQRQRLVREARLAASLDHPNIVRIIEVGEDDGVPFIAMEYLWRGLDSIISDEGRLSEQRVAQIALDIASGLEAAHRAGIVHRDIKPQNVLLGIDGVARVTDFGIARARDLTALTRTGARLGTPHYMSPEQVDGKSADERSDIYSLGCVMYHMLTGNPPFQAESAMAVMRMHLDAVPAPLAARRDRSDAGLGAIVERCMKKDPADRYLTAAELRSALAPLVGSGEGEQVAPGAGAAPYRRFEIGDEDDSPVEQATFREIARAALQPETEARTGKVCRNCGLDAETNRLYCLRCGFSEWRARGESVLAPPFTMTGAPKLNRRDPAPEQARLARAVMLILLATVLSMGLAALLLWSERNDESRAAAFDEIAAPITDLSLPVVKRFTTAGGGASTRVELRRAETAVTGLTAVAFRAQIGGVDSALEIELSPELPGGGPPGPVYRGFNVRVFSKPIVGAERFMFHLELPAGWLETEGIDPAQVRLWTDNGSWAPLETQHISTVDETLTFLATAPRAGLFAIGALQ